MLPPYFMRMVELAGKPVVLYDGHCRFCKQQMRNLLVLAPTGALQPLSFQEEGVLDRFEGVTYEQCMEAMHLVTPEGVVYRGMEAAARAVLTRPFFGAIAWFYYVPVLRQLLDALYRWIADRRYKIAGESCEDGTCALHH